MTASHADGRTFDVVVIGSGLGGLSAAGFLAKAGLSVCLLERNERAGGCVAGFEQAPYTFDPAVGAIARGVDDELRDGILAHLGARERCELVPLEHAYRVVSGDVDLVVPIGLEAMIEAHARLFPAERDAVARFFTTCDRILEDAHRLPLVLPFGELDSLAERFPTFVRYRTALLGEVLDDFFEDESLKRVVAASWPWAGLQPARLSFSTFAQGLALLAHGTYEVVGSFSRLVDALVAGFVEAGGTFRPSTAAARIRVQGERVSGVELEDGEALSCRAVVGNADATTTFERLLGLDPPRLTPSVSATVVFLAAPRPVTGPAETFLADDDDGAWVSARDHVLAVRALTERGVPRNVVELTQLAKQAFPDTGDAVASFTPADFAERTGNREGAIYGWANTPRQTGSRRLSVVGPVAGLYLAGHWAQPGHGTYRAVLSGMHAARALLADQGAPDAVPEFRAAAN